MRRSIERLSLVVATLLALVAAPARAAEPVHLGIKVIHAHNRDATVDPKLKDLVKEFSSLKFKAYALKDEAMFNLELGSAGRMQLPTKDWMTVRPRELSADGKLRIEMEVEKIKFKTTVAIGPGATLAVGGPPFEDGALILAVTRDPKSQATKP
jgi:hypothetical protein